MASSFKILLILVLSLSSVTGQGLFDPSFNRIIEQPAAGSSCTTSTDAQTGTSSSSLTVGIGAPSDWVAGNFTAGSSYTVCKAVLRLAKQGSPTFTLNVFIYTDNAGFPGTQVGTGSANFSISTLTTSEADATFTGISASLINGSTYWIVLKTTSAPNDFTNYGKWFNKAGTALTTGSSDGISWNATSSQNVLYTLYK